jgi:lysozyme family protein
VKDYLAKKVGGTYVGTAPKENKFRDDAIDEVIETEGGFANHKKDRGGATKFGVTKKTYEAYMSKQTGEPYKATVKEMRQMKVETAKDVYKTMFWNEIDGDKIKNYDVAHTLLDQAIHSGPTTAIKRIQKVLGIEEDGHMGEATVNAINAADESELLDLFLDETEKNYRKIVKNNPSQKVFAKGWKKRAKALRDKAEDET